MVQPTISCKFFCIWLLNISWQKLTTSQRNIVTEVFNASTNQTPISQQTWNNFNLFTAWRYPYYLVYSQYSNFAQPSFLSGLLASWSFDGNFFDGTGNYNGTAPNLTFNVGNALIGQCAQFASGNPYMTITELPILNTGSMSFWLWPDSTGASNNFITLNSINTNYLEFFNGANNLRFTSGASVFSISSIPYNTWSNITIVCNAGVLSLYLNGVLDSVPASGFTGIQFNRLGYGGFGTPFKGLIDICSVWDRALSNAEILDYYNFGIGIQYPF